MSKGRKDQAKEVIQKVAKTNQVFLTEDMLTEMTEQEEKKDVIALDKKYTALDLCRPKMLLLSLNVWFNW